ncbi:DUF1439 domain-containing protein [Necropsobacter massiliensis]|uniref:DUF1439 domain-containing protein n=1 Tax=Necropsobacter massiliensis TaxID=1400001 RepID=UPI000595B93D|nr:DUF1439 domain-containing protein [Necropsobacter massiliensis]
MFYKVAITAILCLCSLFMPAAHAFISPFAVSEAQVNDYLAQHANISDQFSFPGLFSMQYQLQDLTARIGQTTENRVEIDGSIDGTFKLKDKQFAAKLNLTFDTTPYYDAQKGAVYLKDIRILRWSGSPDSYMQQLQTLMPFLSTNLSALINHIPIYTLDDNNARDVLIKKFAKEIRVEPGKLVLDTGIL